MGDTNQYQFVVDHQKQLVGPFLEIGSHDYGNTQDFRSLFPGEAYVGVDLKEGPGVDLTLDLTLPFDAIDKALEGRRFATIFSFSVMEHCENPFLMAENMTRLLEPGGRIVLSVPFAWAFHGYPSDYWRFTQEGVKKLFPRLDWNTTESGRWHSPEKGDFRTIDDSLGTVSLSGKHYREQGQILRGIGADILKILRMLGLFRWLPGYHYLILPTMIDMIGVLENENDAPLNRK